MNIVQFFLKIDLLKKLRKDHLALHKYLKKKMLQQAIWKSHTYWMVMNSIDETVLEAWHRFAWDRVAIG